MMNLNHDELKTVGQSKTFFPYIAYVIHCFTKIKKKGTM